MFWCFGMYLSLILVCFILFVCGFFRIEFVMGLVEVDILLFRDWRCGDMRLSF